MGRRVARLKKSPLRNDIDKVLERMIVKMEAVADWKMFLILVVPSVAFVVIVDGVARGWA